MRLTTWAWVTPGAFLAAALLAGCGGGGGGGGSSSGGGTTPGAVALTATPGHGFVTLSWTQPNTASGTTYTIQREVGNGSGSPASGQSFESLPSAGGGSAVSVSGTSYQDGSYNALSSGSVSNGTQNVGFPVVGSQYLYQVTASTGQVSNIQPATPFGPGVGINFNGTNSTTASPSPFSNSSSHVYFTYAIPASSPTHPVITMHFVFDYAVTTVADVDHITLDVPGGTQTPDPNATTYTHAQIMAGLSINSGNNHEIDFTSTGLGLTIPVASPYSLVLLNAYVAPSDNAAPANAVPFQFCYYLPGVGNSQVLPETNLNYASQFVYTLQDQLSGS